MISINISEKKAGKILPKHLFGAPYGDVYVMKGGTGDPTYFLTCGGSANPLMFWYNEETKSYEVCPADLNGYAAHIYVEKINCEVLISLEVKS